MNVKTQAPVGALTLMFSQWLCCSTSAGSASERKELLMIMGPTVACHTSYSDFSIYSQRWISTRFDRIHITSSWVLNSPKRHAPAPHLGLDP